MLISATAYSPAGPGTGYHCFCTGLTWPRWAGVDTVGVERDGASLSGWTDPAAYVGEQRVGDVRVLRTGGRTVRQTITGLEPGSRVDYADSGGAVGSVRFTATASGSRIDWQVVPSGAARVFTTRARRALRRRAEALAAFAAPPPGVGSAPGRSAAVSETA